MSEYFPGFGVRGYRSFDSDVQWIKLDPQTTVVLGPNNAGKSNVLRLIQEIAPEINSFQPKLNFDAHLDFFTGGEDKVGVFWPLAGQESLPVVPHSGPMSIDLLKQALVEISDGERPHLYFEWLPSNEQGVVPNSFVDQISKWLRIDDRELQRFTSSTTGTGEDRTKNIRRLLQHISSPMVTLDQPVSISPLRFVRSGPAGETVDGSGMVETIRQLRSPPAADYKSVKLHKDLCRSVEELLNFRDVDLVVPDGSDELVVHHDGKQLPLSSLGTGTEHALIVLTAAVTNPGRIVCIEEPELHLHPRLQRKLVKTLADRAQSQLILTTHSPTFVDMHDIGYIQVRQGKGRTQLVNLESDGLIDAVRDLGARASDVLQSNFLIWVEGPSDRIYLRRWLELIDESLEENRDYTFAFSSGGLISHLGTDGDEDLIDLRRLNQNFVIMADLDDAENPKPWVLRLEAELGEQESWRFWKTPGRTVENLLPHDVLDESVKAVHPSAVRIDRTKADVDLLTRVKKEGKDAGFLMSPNKVAIALEAAARLEDLSHSPKLEEWVKQLAAEIRTSGE